MSRMAVIFDPGVEGLAAMAAAVAAGARDKGAQAELLDAGRMDAAALSAYDAAAFGFSPACEAALLPVYVRALETLCGRRVAVFGIRPDDGGVFADTLEKICGYAKAVWRGACFCASPSEEALGRCGALGEGAVRAREARPDLADTVPIIFCLHRRLRLGKLCLVGMSERQLLLFKALGRKMSLFALRNPQPRGGPAQVDAAPAKVMP